MADQTDVLRCSNIARLMAAAIVDGKFRQMLLTDPAMALIQDYGQERLHLSGAERALILSVQQPASLTDFARQLIHNAKMDCIIPVNQP